MNQAVSKSKVGSVTELSKFLDSMKAQMQLALPSHLTADRMVRLVLTEFRKTPKLLQCTVESIASCVMTSSQLGLEIGVNGQAYMIPYGNVATFVPGWKGLIDLVNRAGRATVWTGAVFEGDYFEWELGSEPKVVHRPRGESEPSKMTHAYAVGKLAGSEMPVIECWPNDRLKKHFAKNNKVGQRHYANTHWEMYCRKIVLLQVLKYLPQSVEMATAIEAERESEKTILSGAVVGGSTQLDRLTETLSEPSKPKSKGKKSDPQPEPEQLSEGEIRDALSKLNTKIDVAKWVDDAIDAGGDSQMLETLGHERLEEIEGGE